MAKTHRRNEEQALFPLDTEADQPAGEAAPAPAEPWPQIAALLLPRRSPDTEPATPHRFN
ncbi:MAG: hypothetical protein RJA44_640 [Pseudomonadota bacterium]|jgi:hypothetical protein